ncbi:hypothetical protein K431DRAFT_284775 [Polychaeton citri CBS 116435]|uniref:DDHD domain-containing protein n=1 Tax=Polychaeton citri CBS 116435 TaxID=1314669 RepID=A0A9P4Q897_9PEZI|nr:hypothetical protein K431DRAFT_284775 [Polychaeton citri CBS 116435]
MTANQYTREVLHHTEPPPPVEARFFYTSPIPIDDPLAPLPPPASSGTWANNQPPKPFSGYDNAALDEAWHVLRRKILKHNEEHGEKPGSQGRDRGSSGSVRDGKQPSRPGTPAMAPVKPVRHAGQGQVELATSVEEHPSSVLDVSHPLIESASPSNTTGTPFVRAPSRKRVDTLRSSKGDHDAKRPSAVPRDTYSWEDRSHLAAPTPPPLRKVPRPESPTASVAVGMSRLHQVEMPALQMTPIYWTPVNDIAGVIRGTWFYEDTMLPVETAVANMLEAGYLELQVWTDTWKDELNSAIEVGAIGEMKIAHKLWPEKPICAPRSRPSSVSNQNLLNVVASNLIDNEPKTPEQLRLELLEIAGDAIDIAAGPGGADNKASGLTQWGANGSVKTYSQCGVIYSDDQHARILKPSLMPSAYYGRRPLANYIRKDRNLGIKVVRGFDQGVWDRLHPPKKTKQKADVDPSISVSGSAAKKRQTPSGPALEEDPAIADKRRVTDLVLVVHGIGQKLSQRMESFHFTHSINAFRRDVNVELATRDVKLRLRNGMGGAMTLPINWRHSLSFEEGGYSDESNSQEDFSVNRFGLSDITPETLPSVRNIVSDVMLDIPYYMSHHQPKMIAAVIREANRVYKLWCANNPGFHQYGRVHIIAHSLGSVMAVDILSRQPTCVPDHLEDPAAVDLEAEDLHHFLFNTSNLFLAGSPAGFFLLLKKSQLLPRIDHPSATADPDLSANTHVICGERGTYGCLPVDNVFNVINPYDPVSYRMNAAVDNSYAASLKQAWVPSATSSWLGMSFFGSGTGGANATRTSARLVATLPSNVELETHNFNREEIAEKRMYLLNDNGQIDFFLKYGGGPLEIQYLTMLGAHSSYWLLKDFVRMVVTEVGREPGRDGTLVGMRAVKKKGAVV